MKTVLFSGIAATAMIFAASNAAAKDPKPAGTGAIEYRPGTGVAVDREEPEDDAVMQTDGKVYEWGDNGNVAFAGPDGSSYSYDGEWDGKYVDPQGRVFEGDWSGKVTRHDGVSGPAHPAPRPHPHAGAPYPEPDHDDYDDYDVPYGYESYERCLKSNGVTGAAIGALLGGFVGNRVAGRGDRLGGTLVGAGVGGLLGVAVEKANDKCKQHRPHPARPPVAHHGYGRGWQGGYYYYPQPAVTVITYAPVTTTTVTEEVYYETVKAHPRKRAIRKWKQKPKPRCVC